MCITKSFAGPPQERRGPLGGRLGVCEPGAQHRFAGPPQERRGPLGGRLGVCEPGVDANPAFHACGGCRQAGFSLIEVVLFILIVGVALSAVLNVYNLSAVGSVDPVLQRQSLAIAQAMLEEIRGQPFGSPDTDDVDQGGFAGDYTPENRHRFDDVDDYAGFSMHGARTLDNVALAGLEGFNVSVAVANAAFGGVPVADGYRITVTVTDPAGRPLVLQGYRANY